MKLQDLKEVKVHRNDPAMDDVYDDDRRKERDLKDAPYYVRWSGQSFEWYGDEGPESGQGRYKPKGDGGKIVAINIPTYAEAVKIATELNNAYQEHRFPDQSVYGEWGKDWGLVDYQGADVLSMHDMSDWDRRDLKYDKPKDYSK